MRKGSTTDPDEKSRTSGQLNCMMLVVSSCRLLQVDFAVSSRESESERAGLTRAASFLATRLAFEKKKTMLVKCEVDIDITCFTSLAAGATQDRVVWWGGAGDSICEIKHILWQWICCNNINSYTFKGRSRYIPILPSLRVRFFVAVPAGNLSHFHEPTLSYLNGSSDDELEWARSTRDFVPPSGMLGTIIGRLHQQTVIKGIFGGTSDTYL
jgi:hypothetical protein